MLSDSLVVGKIHNLWIVFVIFLPLYFKSTILALPSFPVWTVRTLANNQCVGGRPSSFTPVLPFQCLIWLSLTLVGTVMMLYILCAILPKNLDANVEYIAIVRASKFSCLNSLRLTQHFFSHKKVSWS